MLKNEFTTFTKEELSEDVLSKIDEFLEITTTEGYERSDLSFFRHNNTMIPSAFTEFNSVEIDRIEFTFTFDEIPPETKDITYTIKTYDTNPDGSPKILFPKEPASEIKKYEKVTYENFVPVKKVKWYAYDNNGELMFGKPVFVDKEVTETVVVKRIYHELLSSFYYKKGKEIKFYFKGYELKVKISELSFKNLSATVQIKFCPLLVQYAKDNTSNILINDPIIEHFNQIYSLTKECYYASWYVFNKIILPQVSKHTGVKYLFGIIYKPGVYDHAEVISDYFMISLSSKSNFHIYYEDYYWVIKKNSKNKIISKTKTYYKREDYTIQVDNFRYSDSKVSTQAHYKNVEEFIYDFIMRNVIDFFLDYKSYNFIQLNMLNSDLSGEYYLVRDFLSKDKRPFIPYLIHGRDINFSFKDIRNVKNPTTGIYELKELEFDTEELVRLGYNFTKIEAIHDAFEQGVDIVKYITPTTSSYLIRLYTILIANNINISDVDSFFAGRLLKNGYSIIDIGITGFDDAQKEQVLLGIEHGIKVNSYLNSSISAQNMEAQRLLLESLLNPEPEEPQEEDLPSDLPYDNPNFIYPYPPKH